MLARAFRRPVSAAILSLVLTASVIFLVYRPNGSALYHEMLGPGSSVVDSGSSVVGGGSSVVGGGSSSARPSGSDAGEVEAVTAPPVAENEAVKFRNALKDPFNFRINDEGPDTVDPIVTRTFYMLKTGAEVMWERLPIHLETTLKRFPYHGIYSDGSGIVAGKEVIDVINYVPEAIKMHDQLTAWRIRQNMTSENWGWDAKKVKVNDGVGGWDTDKYKNVPILVHAWLTAPEYIDWFLMVDDDTYVLTESYAALVRDKDPAKPWYIGSPAWSTDLQFAHGGSGILLSRGAVKAMLEGNNPQDLIDEYSEFASRTCCGDLTLAYPLMRAGVVLNSNLDEQDTAYDPFQGNSLVNTRMLNGGWCQRLVSFHHLLPWEIQILFDRENYRHFHRTTAQRRRGDLYTDYYQDFLLPYMQAERHNWAIYAEGITLEGAHDVLQGNVKGTLMPHLDKDDCVRACEAEAQCLGWEWFRGKKCVLETRGILRGEALNPHSVNWAVGQEPVTSGWMIDRIRRMRAAAPCDPLEYDEATGKYNDSSDTSEGWFFRMKDKQKLEASLTLSSAAKALEEGRIEGAAAPAAAGEPGSAH